ncbi:hypothetical protein ACH4OW_26755 [Streptomyces sp. NPDC017056]|uniref:hypothetical protein n=1 Tax=Streptomyces sp. NPDC017056 TaxID=3364973 RepID=UPI0037A1080D
MRRILTALAFTAIPGAAAPTAGAVGPPTYTCDRTDAADDGRAGIGWGSCAASYGAPTSGLIYGKFVIESSDSRDKTVTCLLRNDEDDSGSAHDYPRHVWGMKCGT